MKQSKELKELKSIIEIYYLKKKEKKTFSIISEVLSNSFFYYFFLLIFAGIFGFYYNQSFHNVSSYYDDYSALHWHDMNRNALYYYVKLQQENSHWPWVLKYYKKMHVITEAESTHTIRVLKNVTLSYPDIMNNCNFESTYCNSNHYQAKARMIRLGISQTYDYGHAKPLFEERYRFWTTFLRRGLRAGKFYNEDYKAFKNYKGTSGVYAYESLFFGDFLMLEHFNLKVHSLFSGVEYVPIANPVLVQKYLSLEGEKFLNPERIELFLSNFKKSLEDDKDTTHHFGTFFKEWNVKRKATKIKSGLDLFIASLVCSAKEHRKFPKPPNIEGIMELPYPSQLSKEQHELGFIMSKNRYHVATFLSSKYPAPEGIFMAVMDYVQTSLYLYDISQSKNPVLERDSDGTDDKTWYLIEQAMPTLRNKYIYLNPKHIYNHILTWADWVDMVSQYSNFTRDKAAFYGNMMNNERIMKAYKSGAKMHVLREMLFEEIKKLKEVWVVRLLEWEQMTEKERYIHQRKNLRIKIEGIRTPTNVALEMDRNYHASVSLYKYIVESIEGLNKYWEDTKNVDGFTKAYLYFRDGLFLRMSGSCSPKLSFEEEVQALLCMNIAQFSKFINHLESWADTLGKNQKNGTLIRDVEIELKKQKVSNIFIDKMLKEQGKVLRYEPDLHKKFYFPNEGKTKRNIDEKLINCKSTKEAVEHAKYSIVRHKMKMAELRSRIYDLHDLFVNFVITYTYTPNHPVLLKMRTQIADLDIEYRNYINEHWDNIVFLDNILTQDKDINWHSKSYLLNEDRVKFFEKKDDFRNYLWYHKRYPYGPLRLRILGIHAQLKILGLNDIEKSPDFMQKYLINCKKSYMGLVN